MLIDLKALYHKLPKDSEGIEQAAEAVSRFLISTAVNKKFSNGMPKTESRMWARVQDQIDDGANALDIHDDHYKLIVDALKEFACPPALSSLLWALVEHFEKQRENVQPHAVK